MDNSTGSDSSTTPTLTVAVGPVNEAIRESINKSKGQHPDVEFSLTPSEDDEIVQHVAESLPDVMLIDGPKPDHGSESTVIARIRHTTPRTRIVAVVKKEQPEEIVEALREGAMGYVDEHSSLQEIMTTIESSLHHRVALFDDQVASRILNDFRALSKSFRHLTSWERIVLQHIEQGHTEHLKNTLGVDKHLTEQHLGNIATKMFELSHHQHAPPRRTLLNRIMSWFHLGNLPFHWVRDVQTISFAYTHTQLTRLLAGKHSI